MTDALHYLAALVLTGLLICMLSSLAQTISPRLRNWAGLWALCLVVTFAVPVAGAIISMLAPYLSATPIPRGMILLESVELAPALLEGPADPDALYSTSIEWGSQLFLVVYALGVGVALSRLAIGRAKAARIARRSTGPHRAGAHDYWISPEAEAPYAISGGLVRPWSRIVMPSLFADTMSEASLSLITAHEAAHLEHGDDRTGVFLRVLVALGWMSPFTHIFFARWRHAIEVRSDAQAIYAQPSDKPQEVRGVYARTLLEALNIMAGRVRQYPAASFSTHRFRSEKMRIAQIMKGRPPTFKGRLEKAVLAMVAAGMTLAGGISVSAHENSSAPVAIAQGAASAPQAVVIVEGRVTSRFGQRSNPLRRGETMTHHGVDIAAPSGTPIYAPADGAIIEATNIYDGKPAYGVVVIHRSSDGLVTMFAHLDGFTVTPGQTVRRGDQIAMVGNTGQSTGPHVHIETFRDGKRVDPSSVWPDLQ